jgi:hypothetical protein
MSFFTRGFLGGITGANKQRRNRALRYEAEIKGPEQKFLGDAYDTASLGSAKWKPRRFSTIYQSKNYKEGRRVIADSITSPTLYGGSGAPMAPSGLSTMYGGTQNAMPGQQMQPGQALNPMPGLSDLLMMG